MLALLTSLAVGLAVTFGVMRIRRPLPSPHTMRMETVRRRVFGEPEDVSGWEVAMLPSVSSLGRSLVKLLPSGFLNRIDAMLISAGKPMPLPRFLVIDAIVGAMVALFTLTVIGPRFLSGPLLLLATVAGFAVGALVPLMLVRKKMKKRRALIWRSLPDASDLLTICVEAGMSIDAAIARVTEEMAGPLSEELAAMLREVALGRPRRQALEDVGIRSGVEDLKGMLAVVSQAEESGTRLGPVLRRQAKFIRTQRRLWAEEKARTIPAKMTIPMILLIVPTLFIIILGPLLYDLAKIFMGN